MAQFIVRVVLHGAAWNDYHLLHKEMLQRGLSDVIAADNGTKYKMPDAEYQYVGGASLQQVYDASVAAAKAVGKGHAVMVTEAARMTWSGLSPA